MLLCDAAGAARSNGRGERRCRPWLLVVVVAVARDDVRPCVWVRTYRSRSRRRCFLLLNRGEDSATQSLQILNGLFPANRICLKRLVYNARDLQTKQ